MFPIERKGGEKRTGENGKENGIKREGERELDKDEKMAQRLIYDNPY